MSNGTQFVGASSHKLFADWMTAIMPQDFVWSAEVPTMRSRSLDLWCNEPFYAAMVGAELHGTHGPSGLRFHSLADPAPDDRRTSPNTRALRRSITAATDATWRRAAWSADGTMTRRKAEYTAHWMGCVLGDGFGVRVSGSDGRDRWRLIEPDRISNPDGRPNDQEWRDGLRFVNGEWTGVAVQRAQIGAWGSLNQSSWQYVPVRAADGSPNVFHRFGYRLPGMARGIPTSAPLLLLLRQLQGTVEGHVVAKRAQAVMPIVYQTDDEEELAAALAAKARLGVNAVLGPLSVVVARKDAADVKFMETKFNGADLKDFLTTCYRTLSATRGLPIEVVLAQMADASLSSARAGLDHFDRVCQGFQNDHIEEVGSKIDEAAIRESVARGDLDLSGLADDQVTAGDYARPPKYSTDRLKDANTIKTLMETEVSGTTAFAQFGLSWEDEQEKRAEEASFRASQGLAQPLVASAPVASPVEATPVQGQEQVA